MSEPNLTQDYLVPSLNSNAMDVLNTNSNTFDPLQLFAILKRRRITTIAVFASIVSSAIFFAVIAKTTYKSSMTLLISSLYQRTNPNPYTDTVGNEFVDPFLRVDYTAQLNLMRSSRLIQKAVKKLKVEYPDITEEDIIGEEGKRSPLVIEQVLAGAGTNKTPSQVFSISYEAEDSAKAQKVLQTLQQIYFDYNIEEQEERLRRGLSFINGQLPEVERKVIQAQNDLRQFRTKNNLLDPEIQGKSLLESLTTVENARRTNSVSLQALQARYTSLQQQLAQSPNQAYISGRLSGSGRYQELLNQLQKAELELAQSQRRYTDNSPVVKRLLEQRQSLIELIRQEAGRVLNSVQPQFAEKSLLNQGQFGKLESTLVDGLIAAQTERTGLIASEQKLAEQEQQIRSEVAKYPALLAQFNLLKPEAEVNQATLEQLLKTQQSLALQIAQGGFNWETLQAPKLGISLGSGRVIRLILGILAGAMIAIAVALILEILDDKVYDTNELPKWVTVPLLGKIPKLQSRLTSETLTLDWIIQPPVREAFDLAYQQIQFSRTTAHALKSIVIASALPNEGKSTVAVGLALSAMRIHKRILLIDADLRCSSLHQILQISNERGLSQYLENSTNFTNPDLKAYIQSVEPELDVLTAGPRSTNPLGSLSSRTLENLIKLSEQNYDLVIVDVPPSLGIADATLVSSYCDATVLVCGIGQVSRAELQEVTNAFDHSKILGMIINKTEPVSSRRRLESTYFTTLSR